MYLVPVEVKKLLRAVLLYFKNINIEVVLLVVRYFFRCELSVPVF